MDKALKLEKLHGKIVKEYGRLLKIARQYEKIDGNFYGEVCDIAKLNLGIEAINDFLN